MKHYKMFIDESGHPHKRHASKYFTLVGIIIEDGRQNELKVRADQLRFKYWDKTNVVFHSEEIGNKVGSFSIFKTDTQLAGQFEKQLLQFLHSCPVYVVSAIVDKRKAYRIGWKEETIITKAGESLVMDFLAFLYGQDDAQGRIVYETSGSTRDALYLKAFHRYLDPNWEQKHPEFAKVREHITSITFASKLNHDTEMQLADIFSYAATCHHKQTNSLASYEADTYEQRLIDILVRKALLMSPKVTNPVKLKYYSQIKGIAAYPEIIARPIALHKKKKRTA